MTLKCEEKIAADSNATLYTMDGGGLWWGRRFAILTVFRSVFTLAEMILGIDWTI
jgi:hypothetical protein